jgi:hypothetical protein
MSEFRAQDTSQRPAQHAFQFGQMTAPSDTGPASTSRLFQSSRTVTRSAALSLAFVAVRWVLSILLVLAVAAPAMAAGETEAESPDLEASIQQGIALRKAGNDDAALSLFLDLERKNPESIRVMLHITAAAQATGRWLMAYSYLHKASSHKNDPYFIRYRVAIKGIEDAINQHVGQFRAVGAPPGAEVRLNGEVVGTLPMIDAKPIEVGQYVLEVTKGGYYPLRRAVSVGAGSALTQESADLRLNTTGASVFNADQRNVPVSTRPRAAWQARWITYTLATLTVASAATSVTALVWRNVRASRWNDDSKCLSGTLTRQERCPGVRSDISTAQDIAIGSGIAAAVFGGATLTHLLLSLDRPQVATATSRTWGCNPGLASIACSGSF